MSVIVEFTLPAREFELGRILTVDGPTHVTLETMVPLGERPTPFIRVRNEARESFEQSVGAHSSVNDIRVVDSSSEETLYALNWEPSPDSLFDAMLDMGAALLSATGSAETWEFKLRFPSHETLSQFQEYYIDRGIQVSISRVYNPTNPGAGPWYGLTTPQRETLTYAVAAGYYSMPRRVSTKEIAAEFDISDQAVTERLRRGITTLVTNTLLAAEEGH